MALVAGIDFGTSNSSAACLTPEGLCTLIELEPQKPAMPTALFFDEHTREAAFGTPAVLAFTDREPGRLMRNIKRILGTPTMRSTTQVNGQSMKFVDIVTLFLRELKTRIEAQTGEEVAHVVMGRPVRFTESSDEHDREAEAQLHACAVRAGFRHVVFQFEPVAAAFAHERPLEEERLACVVDIGGGTSDITVLRVGGALRHKTDRSDDILANTGVRVGGADFDKLLCQRRIMPELGYGGAFGPQRLPVPTHVYGQLSDWSEVNFAYTARNLRMVRSTLTEALDPVRYARLLDLLEQERGHELLRVVEDIKFDLTSESQTRRRLACVLDEPQLALSRDDFEACVAHPVDRIASAIRECLHTASVSPETVDLVILTGGSTEMPLIRQRVRELLPHARWSEANKFSSVSTGLAYDGARRFGHVG